MFQHLNERFRYLDHTEETTIFQKQNNALLSFALDDAIATVVGERLASPTVRLWKHDRTLVLGIPDSRLPHLDEAVQYMRRLGIDVVIRNSGGLAVMLDQNVLNMSLIVENNRHLSIHAAYEIMYRFIQQLFQKETTNILAYEIEGSYCPGDYDLSIDGKKFAGISQRRVRNGVAIQIYLDVTGSSKQRAELVRTFYEIALGDSDQTFTFPKVNPHVMASLSELLDSSFTVDQVATRIRTYLQENSVHTLETHLLPEEKEIFLKRYRLMEKRNERLKE